MAVDVMDHVKDSVYWAYYHLCLEDNENILTYLDGLPYDFVLEYAVLYNTNLSLKVDDLNKEWNSIKKSVVDVKYEHNKERHANLQLVQKEKEPSKKVKRMVRISASNAESSEKEEGSSEEYVDEISYVELEDDGYSPYGTGGYR